MKPILLRDNSYGHWLVFLFSFLTFNSNLAAQELSLSQDSICISLLSGETADRSLFINNTSSESYDYEIAGLPLPYDSTSTIQYFGLDEFTMHEFDISKLEIDPATDTLYFTITVNGDFNELYEMADIFIQGYYYENIGNSGPVGTDISREIKIFGNQLEEIILFNEIHVELINYGDVGIGEGGSDTHSVRLEKKGIGWLELGPLSGNIPANGTAELQLHFMTDQLPSGTYSLEIPLATTYPNEPTLYALVKLEIIGQTIPVFPEVPFDFGEVLNGTQLQRNFIIENQGSDAYIITSFSIADPQFVASEPFAIVEPFSTYELPITFTPDALGDFSTNLLISSTIGDTLISITGMGVDPAAIEVSPDSLCVNLLSGDTRTEYLYINNPGNSTLEYEMSILPDPSKLDLSLYENFNDEDYGSFNLGNTQAYTIDYTTDDPAEGDYALKMTGTDFNYFNGLYAEINDAEANYVRFWFKSETSNNEDVIVSLRDFSNGINDLFFMDKDYNDFLNIYTGVEFLNYPYTVGSWALIELKEIDFDKHTYDLYINEDLIRDDLAFNDYANQISRIDLFNRNTGTLYFDEVVIGEGQLELDWIELAEENGSVALGQQDSTAVLFNTEGLLGGTYHALIELKSNVPNQEDLLIPCKMNLTGIARLALSAESVDFGDTYLGYPGSKSVSLYNVGTESLLVSGISSSDGSISVNPAFGIIAPFDSLQVNLSYDPDSPGMLDANLLVQSSDRDTTIRLFGHAVEAPLVNINPEAICDTLIADESKMHILNVNNAGAGTLNYSIPAAQPGLPTLTEVLILSYGNENSINFQNTLVVLNQSNNNYNIETINTTSPTDLAQALEGKQVLLLPESQWGEYYVFMELGSVIRDFAENGGTVIFCAIGYGNMMEAVGLFQWNGDTYVSPGENVELIDPTHPIVTGIDGNLTVTDETRAVVFGDLDLVPLVNYFNDYRIIAYRNAGLGKAIYIGYDYYQYDDETALVLNNAIKWAGNDAFPEWLSPAPYEASVAPMRDTALQVTLDATGLETGDYQYNIWVETNDPGRSRFQIPVKLHVIAPPISNFISDSRYNCGSDIHFTDQSLNQPTNWLWNFGDGNFSTDQHPAHAYTADGAYDVSLIACNILDCDTLVKTNYITVDLAGNYCDTILFSTIFDDYRETNACTGYLFDDGGTDGNYSHNNNSTIVINPDSGQQVRLDFNSFDLQWGDYLTIYDGVDNTANYLGDWSGTDVPGNGGIISTRGGLTLRFTSDNFNNSPGFEARWQCGTSFPPIASFEYYFVMPCGSTVDFMAMTNGATGILWDFGDGTTSTDEYTFHTYPEPGVYEVNLYAFNGTDTTVVTQSIDLSDNGLFINLLVPDTAIIGQPVTFSFTNAGEVMSVQWDINDGEFLSEEFSLDYTFSSVGEFNYFLAAWGNNGCDIEIIGTIVIVLPVGNKELEAVDHFNIYPNPSEGLFNLDLSLDQARDVQLQIFNSLGQKVLERTYDERKEIVHPLDLRTFSNGVYFLEIRAGDLHLRRRLVKQ